MYLGTAALAVAGAVGYKMWTSPEPLAIRMDPDNRSVILEDGSRIAAVGGDREDYRVEGVHTLYDAFRRGHKLSKYEKCLGERTGPNKEYEWLTYDQVLTRAENLASGLIHLGLSPGDRLGIYSTNNTKWVITEQGCNTQSLVLVPLYDSHGPEACRYIINLTELGTIVCDTADRSRRLIAQSADLPTLKALIVMAPVDDELRREAAEHKLSVHGFDEVERFGENNPHAATPPKSSDVATICFTSGTTGVPKGAMLSHGNMVTNASCLCIPDYFGQELTTDECHFSYLPLAHMYERTIQVMMFLYGCRIGFFRGDVKLLLDDIQALKPTIFTAVPRILNKIYDKVQAGVNESRIKKYLFDIAIQKKDSEIKQRIIRKNSIWDKLVLRKVQALLGGNVRMMTCGSAPLSAEVLRFTRAAFGCFVLEGYGQTEATAAVTFQFAGDFTTGHVGGPVACNRVKLVDVPEMGYTAADGKGEVCAKGDNVFLGYYKCPEKTAEALDSDGWLHTGDIGQWLPNGALKIIDRKKNIYKLSQGEYIAPEKVENVYLRSRFVAQAFMDGDSLKSRSMAVIVPDPDTLLPWASSHHLPQDMVALCKDPSVKSAIMKDIEEHGRAAGLTTLEQVKDIYLFHEPFSLENGLTTPTFKNRRNKLSDFFASEFEAMYKNTEVK